jgi:hypothetical protein
MLPQQEESEAEILAMTPPTHTKKLSPLVILAQTVFQNSLSLKWFKNKIMGCPCSALSQNPRETSQRLARLLRDWQGRWKTVVPSLAGFLPLQEQLSFPMPEMG